MKIENILDTKNSLELYGLDNYLDNLISLFEKKKFPKILLLTGAKGLGKNTLINHFLSYVFDKENYQIGDFVNVLITDCTSATLIGNAVNYSKNSTNGIIYSNN